MMRVAIVHYHLRSGGVSRVIEHAAQALAQDDLRLAVLVGEPPPPEPGLPAATRVVDGLDYADDANAPTVDTLVERLETAARDALGGAPDLWHFHNHSMGKNGAVTAAITRLAAKGHRLLLQIHDFAEDGRPQLFRGLLAGLGEGRIDTLSHYLYPLAPQIHYAAINGRDAALLKRIGIPPERLHLLPNAATLEPRTPTPWNPDPNGPRKILYPVRAIRRKNLGELLLWAAGAEPDTRFAVTLAPKSLADRGAYEYWTRYAREQKLPVDFEVGVDSNLAFEDRLAQAWVAVTTSIAEGFGLTFLEPWLLNRPVVGRKLPEITDDLEANGVDLSGLYAEWRLPADWLDTAGLRTRIRAGYTAMLEAYGRTPEPDVLARAEAALLADGTVDFGRLDETAQAQAIAHVRRTPGDFRTLSPARLVNPATAAAALEGNRARVAAAYHLAGYGERLRNIYRALGEAPVAPPAGGLDVARLLDGFLAPERFNLLRT